MTRQTSSALHLQATRKTRNQVPSLGTYLQLAHELVKVMRSKPTYVFTVAEIVEHIIAWRQRLKLHPKKPVTEAMARGVISEVRQVLEQEHQTTLHTLKGVGWRLATKPELAIFAMRQLRRTIIGARRTHQLLLITPREELPAALRKVFDRQKALIYQVASDEQHFLERLMEYRAQHTARPAILDRTASSEHTGG